MIPVLEMTGFFLAITAALQFSSWAEAWLTPRTRSPNQRTPDSAALASNPFPLPSREVHAVRVP